MVVVGADRPGVNPPILLWRAHEGPIVVAAVIEAGHETGRVARIFLGPEGSEEIEEVEAIAGRDSEAIGTSTTATRPTIRLAR